MATALLLVGPAPFLDFSPSKDQLFVCAALIGFGYAQVLSKMIDEKFMLKYSDITFQTIVSTFSRANNAALRQGFANDMRTYLAVAGAKGFQLKKYKG